MAKRSLRGHSNNLIDLLKNSKNALCIDGICYSIPMDNEDEVFWINYCAKLGNANARFQLALCMITGNVVCKNYSEAIKLMELAAKEITDIQFYVALCYTYGILVEKDSKKAVYWYEKAVENGCDEAMCNLGICYLSGFGVERSIETAYDLLIKAAKAPVGIIKKGNGYAKSLCSHYAWAHKDKPQSTGFTMPIKLTSSPLQRYMSKTNPTIKPSKEPVPSSLNTTQKKEIPMIKDPITERIEKARVVYDYGYRSVLEEGWIKFLADQGLVKAQRVYLALYYAGKFHDKQEEYEFIDLMNTWHLQNDPYSCLIKAKMMKSIYYRKSYDTVDLYNKVPENKGKDAVANLIKAVEGGILCAIPTAHEWRNIGRFFNTPCKHTSIDAPYWENDHYAPLDERFVKDDEPICFALENEEQICFVDYYSKQRDRMRGVSTRYKSIVFKRVLRKQL